MSLTIGKQLRLARQAKNLSIINVSEATHIRSTFIELLEQDNFEAFPSAAQARGFLNNYAEYLGLQMGDLLALQRETIPSTPGTDSFSGEPSSDAPKFDTKPLESESINNQEPHRILTLGDKQAVNNPIIDKSDQVAENHVRGNDSGSTLIIEPEIEAKITEVKGSLVGSASVIFTSIGKELSGRRELLGMSLDEIERHIHVRKYYLEIIESGEFDKLPSSVQARGMINNYAHFLDMDADKLLLRFADGLQIQQHEKLKAGNLYARPPHRGKFQRGIRRYLSIDMLIGGGLIIILLIFAVWGTNKIISLQNVPAVNATAPSISDILLITPTPGNPLATNIPVVSPAVLPSASDQTDIASALPTGSTGNIQLIVVALERALVVVTVDGVVKFNGRVVPDTAYPFDAKNQIEVLTSNGAAIRITYNGADLGVMGTFGQVVNLIYTSTAIITPTSTSTPTATISPLPSATPTQSVTPKPSATPTSSITKTP